MKTVVLKKVGTAPWRVRMWRVRALLAVAAEYGTFWPPFRKE